MLKVLLIDSDARFAQLHRRQDEQWVTELVPGHGRLRLASIGIEIALSELYESLIFDHQPT